MKTEQLEAILKILKDSEQEDVQIYFEENGESIPLVATIKQSGVLKENLVSLMFYRK